MVKVIDHQQTGKRKFIIGPGRKKDKPLVEEKPETKFDIRTNTYLQTKTNSKSNVNTTTIIERRIIKKSEDIDNLIKQQPRYFHKSYKKSPEFKFLNFMMKSKNYINYLNIDETSKKSIFQYIVNITKIIESFRLK